MPVYQRRHPHYLHSASRFRTQTHITAVAVHWIHGMLNLDFFTHLKYICTLYTTLLSAYSSIPTSGLMV
jgi:hypothetical protein